jgi:hypothetical protein
MDLSGCSGFGDGLLSWQDENELRLVPGDELRLRYLGDGIHSGWQSVGHVVRS